LLIEAVDKESVYNSDVIISDAKRHAHHSTQLEILKSQDLAEQVVDSLGLVNHEAFKPKMHWGRWLSLDTRASKKPLTYEKKKARAVEQLRNSLIVIPIHNSSLVMVGYESSDANLSASIANELSKTYIEKFSEDRHHMVQQMVGWLSRKIDELKVNLEESEKALQEYRETVQLTEIERVKAVSAGELDDLTANLAKKKHIRTQIEKALEQVNDLPSNTIDALSSMPEVVELGIVQQLKSEQVIAEKKVVEMSKRYNRNHPKMVAAVSKLALVKDSMKKKIARIV
jgi:uncharacterized protein involved in exopolysaccharide biosynthesis